MRNYSVIMAFMLALSRSCTAFASRPAGITGSVSRLLSIKGEHCTAIGITQLLHNACTVLPSVLTQLFVPYVADQVVLCPLAMKREHCTPWVSTSPDRLAAN
jgi:hypothetical protein